MDRWSVELVLLLLLLVSAEVGVGAGALEEVEAVQLCELVPTRRRQVDAATTLRVLLPLLAALRSIMRASVVAP